MTKAAGQKKEERLGELESVDIKEHWPNEAYDFTPWLERNINLLGDVIDLELEVETGENKVGDFSADIVCRNTADGHQVIVENQYNKTDHDHLGKLLTYAAGKGATVVIWIAEAFRDEHRAAIDWLNDQTSQDVHFFGIQIELWKIGNSLPAPRFHVVCKPNDWTKVMRQTGEMRDTQKLQLKFWTGLRDAMERKPGKVKSRRPAPFGWTTFSIGRRNFHLDAVFGILKGRISVQLIMDGENAKDHYQLLFKQKEAIEKEIGKKLEWQELPDKKTKKVSLWRNDCAVQNEQQWGDFHSWLHEYLEKFYDVFYGRTQKLDADDWQPQEDQTEDA